MADVIEVAERLIVGWLTGQPVPCELAHRGKDTPPEAITIVVVDLAACEAHAAGTVAP